MLHDGENGMVAFLHILHGGVDVVFALMRPGGFKGIIDELFELALEGAFVDALGVAGHADFQGRIDIKPNELAVQKIGHKIALGILGGHRRNHDTQALTGQQAGQFSDPAVIFQSGLGLKP